MATEGYDDYGSFTSDPVDLEKETSEIFGRFFQTSLSLGTGIFTGGLGSAYAPGFLGNLKFVYYFDKTWATEIGFGFGNNQGLYNPTKTLSDNINLSLSMNWLPIYFGFRFGFDPDELARGFSMMNPYLSAQAEYIFRNERVIGTAINGGLSSDQQVFYGTGGSRNTNAFGVNLGGGIEFDVYKKQVLLGLDLRFHVPLWSDRAERFGILDRTGNIFTIMGVATYNY
jgi:hypothetical protein